MRLVQLGYDSARLKIYSASGCFSGAALAKAGSAAQWLSIRSKVGNRERSQPNRRALASCGTRQISATVGTSPAQNLAG